MGTASKTNKKTEKSTTADPAIDPASQLHEIQKLLFGRQIEQLETAIAELKSETQKHLGQMEKQYKDSLEKQRKEHNAQLSEIAQKLEEDSAGHSNREALLEDELDALRKSLDQLGSQTEAAHDALERQMLSESQHIHEELNEKHKQVLEQLKTGTEQLGDQKLDRAVLAELLTSIAHKIHPQA